MKKEYISPVTKMVLVRLSGSVLQEPGMGPTSQGGFENLGKETFFGTKKEYLSSPLGKLFVSHSKEDK